jgi:hypothetical protein
MTGQPRTQSDSDTQLTALAIGLMVSLALVVYLLLSGHLEVVNQPLTDPQIRAILLSGKGW